MSCLNGNSNNRDYDNFDIENMQGSAEPPAARSAKSRKRCSWLTLPMLLSMLALACAVPALAVSIYSAVKANSGDDSPKDEGLYLSQNPNDAPSGWRAVNLFQASISLARDVRLPTDADTPALGQPLRQLYIRCASKDHLLMLLYGVCRALDTLPHRCPCCMPGVTTR